jgi:hypothetical protein
MADEITLHQESAVRTGQLETRFEQLGEAIKAERDATISVRRQVSLALVLLQSDG